MTPTDKEITPFKDFMFSEDDKVTIRFLDDTKKLVGQYSTSHYGTIKELTPLIQKKNKKDWGAFFLVNPSETQGTEDKDVLYARALFVDIDNGELPTYFPCKPSYISSREGGGGYHVYWVLESPETDIEKWRLATKALIKFYHSDKSASNPARILRIPGTLNHKLTKDGTGPKYGIIAPKYSIVEKSGLVYDINTVLTAHTDQDALHEQAVRSARAVFPEGKMKEGDGRHHALIKAVYVLNDYGVCGESAFKILKKIVIDCFEDPISDDKVREYVSAQKTAKGEKGQAAVDRELAKQAKIERAETQLKDWYFVRDEEAFYTHGMTAGYSMFSFNALFASICGESNTAKFAFLHNVLRQYACRVYAPSEGSEFPVPGGMAINKYTPTDLEPIDAVPQWFLDHAAYIIPDEKERNIFLDTYAYLLQNPGKKVRYATLIIGGFRTGKSSFAVIFDRVFGSSNVVPVDNETLGEKYTSWVSDHTLAVIHELSHCDKETVYEALKSPITDEYIKERAMYHEAKPVRNYINFLMFSNKDAPIRLPEGDERFFVIRSPGKKKPPEYYAELYRNIDTRCGEVLHYLLNRDVSNFNPFVCPADNEVKRGIMESSKSEVLRWVEEGIEEGEYPFNTDLVSLRTIQSYARSRESGLSSAYCSLNAITAALKKAGAVDLPFQIVTKNGRKRLWAIRNHDKYKTLKAVQEIINNAPENSNTFEENA